MDPQQEVTVSLRKAVLTRLLTSSSCLFLLRTADSVSFWDFTSSKREKINKFEERINFYFTIKSEKKSSFEKVLWLVSSISPMIVFFTFNYLFLYIFLVGNIIANTPSLCTNSEIYFHNREIKIKKPTLAKKIIFASFFLLIGCFFPSFNV